MKLAASLCVFNEQELIGRAIRSLGPLGVDELHLFDGPWRGGKDGAHVFDGADHGASTDHTRGEAYTAATAIGVQLVIHGSQEPWASQESKRTAAFQDVGLAHGDYVLVMDADETVTVDAQDTEPDEIDGTVPDLREWLEHVEPPRAAHVQMKCVGANDMPGIRGEWPAGDYSPFFKPELRLFRWTDDLECVWPGGYWSQGGMIDSYRTEMGRVEPVQPVAPLWMLHHGNDRTQERRDAKLAYYAAEHPERERWQRAFLG